eukprot:c39847_g1_i1.p1 GENE.c39847_g1_i1~~c39847_g1_i1.p1  ORF type:complete len:206 (-),score=19.40 c39847_g1_i1:110-727(-)
MDPQVLRQSGPGHAPGAVDACEADAPAQPSDRKCALMEALASASIVTTPIAFDPEAAALTGVVCANLVVRDKANSLFLLITTAAAGPIRFPELRRRLGAVRCLSFVPPADLLSCMHAAPGAVSPLILAVEPPPPGLTVVLDASVFAGAGAGELPDAAPAASISLASGLFHFHPLDPALSVLLRADELLEVVHRAAVPALIVSFPR